LDVEVDVADNSGLIKIAAIGAAAYLAYTQGWLSFLGIGTAAPATPVTPAAPAPVAPVVPDPNAITGANTLDGIFTRMKATAPAGNHNVDGWNYWLASAGNLTPPDPMPIFQAAVPGFDRAQLLTAAQYWAVMAPALKTQLGLSGLGIYGGLGALMRRYA
jgi:hypothetical protein